jgi:F-type H+-transporting ATPase subunit alpha
MKKATSNLKLFLSQYRDLEAFAAFASDLDAASRAQLDRGARLVELLKQPQNDPFPMEEQVLSIWAGTSGELDDVPIEDIRRFEAEFLDYVKRTESAVLDTIRETGKFEDDTATKLKDLVTEFKKTFETTNHGLLVEDETVEAIDEGDVEQEKITRVRKK